MCVPGCQEAVRHALTRRGFFTATTAAVFAASAATPAPAQTAPRSFRTVVDLRQQVFIPVDRRGDRLVPQPS